MSQIYVSWMFADGHAVDIVLLVILLEAGWLIGRGGWRVADAAMRLLPGVFMLLALRAAMTDLSWPWVAGALLLSFPIHLADLRQRPG